MNKNNNKDTLFPIENWQETWPFCDDFVGLIFYFPATVTNVTELVLAGCLSCDDPEGYLISQEQLNQRFKDNQCGRYKLQDNKIYYWGYSSPLAENLSIELRKLTNYRLEWFRIDHLNFNQIRLMAIKIFMQSQKMIAIQGISPSVWSTVFIHLCNQNISCELTNFIKTLLQKNKKRLHGCFLDGFKKKERHKISLNFQCLKNILCLLDIENNLINNLVLDYQSTNSLEKIIFFIESKI